MDPKIPSKIALPLWSRRRAGRTAATAAARRRRLRQMVASTVSPRRDRRVRPSPARIALTIATTIILSVLLCIHLWPSRVNLHLGDVSEQEIVAQRSVQFDDTEFTHLLRVDAAQRVEKRYIPIRGATSAALDSVETAFDLIERAATPADASIPARSGVSAGSVWPGPRASVGSAPANLHRLGNPVAAGLTASAAATGVASLLRAERDGSLSADAAAVLLTDSRIALLARQSEAFRSRARRAAVRAVERAMSRSITDDGNDLDEARQDVVRDPALHGAIPDPALRDAVAAIAAAATRPCLRYDARSTLAERQIAEAAVPPQMTRYAAGQVIVRPGDTVTQHQLDALTALGLQNPRVDPMTVADIVVLVVLLMSLVASTLRRFHRALYDDTPRLLLLAILVVFSVVGLKVGYTLLGLPVSAVHFGYLGMTCIASAGMVITLLISPGVATLVVGLLAITSGLVLNNELRFTVITLASSLVGIVAVARLRHRSDLVRAAAVLCGANALLCFTVGQLEGDVPRELLYGVLTGVGSGLFAVLMFWFGVALFEKPFGITTHLRLLELSDPATPMLQEFRMRVPGTYAHSLMVANLAHAAAEAIGADALLVRVAAYYHDLGKMNRPEFFIENQSNADNVHDRISPSLSALILSSHVKEGLAMAEALGLPPRVRELIQQHHGTTLMKFFFHRASGGLPNPTLEAQFRYPGPKPQSRESAILMLADSIEAASRTLEKPTPARVSDFVARMVADKLSDGQLDECDMTMRDLRRVQDIFVRTLSGALHARIEYPNSPASPRPALAVAPVLGNPPPSLTLVGGGQQDDPEEQILQNLMLSDTTAAAAAEAALRTGAAPTAEADPALVAIDPAALAAAAAAATLSHSWTTDDASHGDDAAKCAAGESAGAAGRDLGPRPRGRTKAARGGR
jgi:hypothetical protein